ncbi:MAG: type II toxin-antitoxin system Phd/YefM family antitoxin [Alphaproteobacteria bacterium]|nr:MAG: type II toxin-antitoxin system Phd/YefM family antitoxin [Alphaproteobacteria bacterium]
MSILSASQARARLFRLIDEVAESHRPVAISGKRHNAVLVSEEDWSALQETLYLVSQPGMRESIRAGLETPASECDADPGW